jgi:tRNA/tmRNA/rRNA uracil-C5-methylase (TrmA/RlmC/RlmD family)
MVTSLFYVETTLFESRGGNRILHHLHDPEVIVEQLLGLPVETSLMSFFRANKTAAEALFAPVAEWTAVDNETVLMDCYCGIGVIALSMASRAKETIKIDIDEEAIANARRNAELNGIANAIFIVSKAETELRSLLVEKAAADDKIVCVFDPPRWGLQKKTLTEIRDYELIHKLVYISCGAILLLQDVNVFISKTRITASEPFGPSARFGVDVSPHTEQLEVVTMMEQ